MTSDSLAPPAEKAGVVPRAEERDRSRRHRARYRQDSRSARRANAWSGRRLSRGPFAVLPIRLTSGHHHQEHDVIAVFQGGVHLIAMDPLPSIAQARSGQSNSGSAPLRSVRSSSDWFQLTCLPPGSRLTYPPVTLTTTPAPVSPAAQPTNKPYPPPTRISSSITSMIRRRPVGPCGCPQTIDEP